MINKANLKLKTGRVAQSLRFSPATLFSKKWLLPTLLVLVAMGVMVRLGYWQLNRLAQRQARNAFITQQLALPPLQLGSSADLPANLADLNIRQAAVQGQFDYTHQVALKLQTWQGAPGIQLVTPLVLPGRHEAVLVNRGFVPQNNAAPEQWPQFNEAENTGVSGFIRLTETLPAAQSSDQKTEPQQEWFRVDIEAIQAQMPYKLLPVYILQMPAQDAIAATEPPFRNRPEIDLSEGPHMGYAIQWLIFALILGSGYIYYVNKEVMKKQDNSAGHGHPDPLDAHNHRP